MSINPGYGTDFYQLDRASLDPHFLDAGQSSEHVLCASALFSLSLSQFRNPDPTTDGGGAFSEGRGFGLDKEGG